MDNINTPTLTIDTPSIVNMSKLKEEPTHKLEFLVKHIEYRSQLIETTIRGMQTLSILSQPEQMNQLLNENTQNHEVAEIILNELSLRAVEVKRELMVQNEEAEKEYPQPGLKALFGEKEEK